MARWKEIPPPDGYPLFGWNKDAIKAHLEANPPQAGDPMMIYNSHGGLHRYQLAKVESPSHGRQKRIILTKSGQSGGTTFHRSGMNTFSPKGQTMMLPPVAEIMAHLADDCDVLLDLPIFS